MKEHALKMGCSPRRVAEERLSTARTWGRSTHASCISHLTVCLLPHSPGCRGTPEGVIPNTNTSQGGQ